MKIKFYEVGEIYPYLLSSRHLQLIAGVLKTI